MADDSLTLSPSNVTIREGLCALALGFAHTAGVSSAFCERFAIAPDTTAQPGLSCPALLGDLLETARDPARRDAFFALISGSMRHQGASALSTTQRFTPPWIAQWLVDRALHACDGIPLPCLDPACGGGRLLIEAFWQLRAIGYSSAQLLSEGLVGFDLDPLAAEVTRWSLWLLAAAEQPETAAQLPSPLIFAPRRRAPPKQSELNSLGALAEFGLLADICEGWLREASFGLVLSNPPYMGTRHMAPPLRQLLRARYGVYAGDLYTAFLKRCLAFCRQGAGLGVLCQQSFLFLKRDRALRRDLFQHMAMHELLHLGPHAFDGIPGEKVAVVAFSATCRREEPGAITSPCPQVVDLSDLRDSDAKRRALEHAGVVLNASSRGSSEQVFEAESRQDRAACADVPDEARQGPSRVFRGQRALIRAARGDSFAYWWPEVLDPLRDLPHTLGERAEIPGTANKTANNNRFLRFWWEVAPDALGARWMPYAKGGPFCKWHGNLERVVDWSEQARGFYASNPTSNLLAERFWCREGITYSDFGGRAFSARWLPPDALFDMAGPSMFFEPSELSLTFWLGVLNAPLVCHLLNADNPTIHYQVDNLRRLPVPAPDLLTPDNPQVVNIESFAAEALRLSRKLAAWNPTDPARVRPILVELMAMEQAFETFEALVQAAMEQVMKTLQQRDRVEQALAREVEALYGVTRASVAPLDPRYQPPARKAPAARMLVMDALDYTMMTSARGGPDGAELWGAFWPRLRRYARSLEGYRWKRAKKRACHPARDGSLWG